MSEKACKKCGSSDRYANGKCKRCADARVKAYRQKMRGDTRPANPVKVDYKPRKKPKSSVNLAEALSTGKSRLKFMIQRNQETIESLEAETEMLDKRLEAAEQSGSASDVRFLIGERRKLLEARMAYDARLSKDLQAYQELVGEDDDETPIELNIAEPTVQNLVRPSLGDVMDIGNLMPRAAGEL